MRSGDIFEVANVLKHLTYLSHLKPLAFREQRRLSGHVPVVFRIGCGCRQPECNIEPRVEEALAKACAKHEHQPLRAHAAAALLISQIFITGEPKLNTSRDQGPELE